jgi:N-acyl homoserine lactone hydrolase
MTQVLKLWPLLTATHRYDKFLSTRNTGHGTIIEAPILAYLIETRQGRVLFDVGCDYHKLSTPAALAQWYGPDDFLMGPPQMEEDQRLPAHFARLGLTPEDIDLVFLSHLHFDHAGGLYELCGAEVHAHEDEFHAARKPADNAYFAPDFDDNYRWRLQQDDYDLVSGLRAINTPGHTAGHVSPMIELPDGAPVILAGDAADLNENIAAEIAHGFCRRGRGDLATNSIRKLKKVAVETSAEL